MANGNFEIRNKVLSWNLKCFDMKVGDKGVTLNCSLNGKKNPDGSYPKGLPVRVFCSFESCEIAEDDYNNTYVTVDGTFSVGEWTKQDGTKVPQYTIFADKVTKRVFEK